MIEKKKSENVYLSKIAKDRCVAPNQYACVNKIVNRQCEKYYSNQIGSSKRFTLYSL
jgi:hypothetical protein